MSFDPDTYNPFENYSPHRETHQRINHAMREAIYTDDEGRLTHPPLVVDFDRIDATTEQMVNASFQRLSYLDGHEDAQEIAMKTIHGYRDSLRGEHSTVPDISNGGFLVLFGHDPSIPVAIDELAQWEPIAHKHLSASYKRCNLGITVVCDPTDATKIMAVKVGEFVCVYKVCAQCRDWFDLSPDERDQFGGSGWMDDCDRR
jgi:hypothetical protein